MSEWSDARIDELKRLYGEHLSAAQIAKQMGGAFSRNAVLGKLHRLGLALPKNKGGSKDRPPAQRGTYGRAVRLAAAKRRAGLLPPRQKPVRTPPPEPIPPPAAMLLISWDDLTSSSCRWPVGDPREPGFAFCGIPEAEFPTRPYCRYHAQLAYVSVHRRASEHRPTATVWA